MQDELRNCFYFNAYITVFNFSFSHPDVLNCMFQSCSVPSSAPQTYLEISPHNTTKIKKKIALLCKWSFGKPNQINKANYIFWPKETQAKHVKTQDLFYVINCLFLLGIFSKMTISAESSLAGVFNPLLLNNTLSIIDLRVRDPRMSHNC